MSLRQWTLRSKVVLHVVVLGVLSAVILTVVYFATQKNVISTLSLHKAELVGTLIKNSVFLLKKCGRIEDTQAKIHDLIMATPDITTLRILTIDGHIFGSMRPDEQGTALPEEDRRLVREMLAGPKSSRIDFSKSGDTATSLMLVENRAECYGCHDPGKKINGLLQVKFDYRETAALIQGSRWRGIVLAVIALGLLTIIILRLFDRLINRPISRLKDHMKRVQEGDLTVRLESRKDDEIGSLTKSFNAMVENLKTANQKIEALYNQRIEKAEHLAAFGELAAGLAHEVKNPLSGMKGALEIIDRATPASNPHKEIFQEILVQIEKIITIIQDFLSYARPKPPHFRRVSPNFFMEDAVRLAKTQVRGKDIAFEVQRLPDSIVIRLDPDKMQEVLLNLILNSISAIDARGRISIALSASPETGLIIQVTDDGSGISPAQITQIFVPFFSTKKDGTGLGLSICRKTVEAHGGTMAVESREGRGTTFTIRLPFDGPKG